MSFKFILEPSKKTNNKLFNHIRLRPILHLGLILFISIVIGPVSSRPQKYSNTHHQQQYHLDKKEVDSKLKVVENQTMPSYVPMTEDNDFNSEEGEDVITEQMIKNMTEETENGLEQEQGLDTVRKLDDKEQKEVHMEMSVEEMLTNNNGDRGPLFDILRDYGGSEGFRTVLVRAQGLDNSTQDDVLVEELNMTLSTLNATLNSGNVSNISVNDPEYREMQKNNRERACVAFSKAILLKLPRFRVIREISMKGIIRPIRQLLP
uniref:Uncharacterized protein n=1 Tax=Timema genevievae TaxID=629358 RepID=A0A7R9JVK1_TIMGE|nr:unnamed protein product [Timema genevievae]